MHNPESILENETPELLWDIEIQRDPPILGRRSDLLIVIKKGTCQLVDFAIQTDYRLKIKESEKKNKFLYLARELKNQWNVKVTVVPIVVGAQE